MIDTKLFQGKEYTLTVYNGQAIIDRAFRFYTILDCFNIHEEIDFDFPDYVSSYFRIYNERSGLMLRDLSMSLSGSYLVLDASVNDMTFTDNGDYYYEIGYSRAGYETALRYGVLHVI